MKHTRDPLVVVELLETLKADPNVRAVGSNATPLHLAAKQGDLAIIEALLTRGASPNAADKDGWTALLLAAKHGHAECAAALVGAGASMLNRTTKSAGQLTALHLACDAGANAEPLLRVLCFEGNTSLAAALACESGSGETPLHRAAVHNVLGGAQLLLECGAPVNAPQGKQLMAQREQEAKDAAKAARELKKPAAARVAAAAEAPAEAPAEAAGRRRSSTMETPLHVVAARPRRVRAAPPRTEGDRRQPAQLEG